MFLALEAMNNAARRSARQRSRRLLFVCSW